MRTAVSKTWRPYPRRARTPTRTSTRRTHWTGWSMPRRSRSRSSTGGAPMPDGTMPEACAIIILNKEDNWTQVTKPRLIAAGADLSPGKVYFLEGRRRLICGNCGKRDCENPRHEQPEKTWVSVVLPADTEWLKKKIAAVKKVTGKDRVLIYAD